MAVRFFGRISSLTRKAQPKERTMPSTHRLSPDATATTTAPSLSPPLVDAFAAVPDPRCRQGRRFTLAALLTLVLAAMLANHLSPFAIAQWGAEQGGGEQAGDGLQRGDAPSVHRRSPLPPPRPRPARRQPARVGHARSGERGAGARAALASPGDGLDGVECVPRLAGGGASLHGGTMLAGRGSNQGGGALRHHQFAA